MTFRREKLYTSLDTCLYTVFSVEDGDTFLSKSSASEVVDYINSMIAELNENLEEDEEKDSFCANIKDAIERSEYYGLKIEVIDNEENKAVTSLIEQALKFNSSWTGETKKEEYKGYYKFSIKPLYMDDTDYMIQVACALMCPSGISDNGIKYVEQYTLNKQFVKDIKQLCKYLIHQTVRGKGLSCQISYIQF